MIAPPRMKILLVVAVTIGVIRPALGLCQCAERFASSSDFSNDTSTPVFDNYEDGQTIVFRSASFHCNTTLSTVKYSGRTAGCSDCTATNGQIASTSKPILQLWRLNGTYYNMVESMEFETGTGSMDLQWSVEADDSIGLWVPASCDCSLDFLKIGYFYGKGGSRVYRIDGDMVESFDPLDYSLEDGPMPMISVETSDQFDTACIIGLPAGALIAMIALGFVLAGICWSIATYNKKTATEGRFEISHLVPDETEMNEISSNNYEPNSPSDQNTLSRPIYQMPLPPLPTDIDDADFGTRSVTSSPRVSTTGHTLPHSMSNPDLSTHSYGNVDHSFRSLTRQPCPTPRAPEPLPPLQPPPPSSGEQIAQPRLSGQYSNTTTNTTMEKAATTAPAINNYVQPPTSSNPEPTMQDTTDESDAKEQAYDRNSEYELPDDNSSEGGEVHDEYMSMGRLPTGDINSSDSDEVYY